MSWVQDSIQQMDARTGEQGSELLEHCVCSTSAVLLLLLLQKWKRLVERTATCDTLCGQSKRIILH
jgi:hypothetical protein